MVLTAEGGVALALAITPLLLWAVIKVITASTVALLARASSSTTGTSTSTSTSTNTYPVIHTFGPPGGGPSRPTLQGPTAGPETYTLPVSCFYNVVIRTFQLAVTHPLTFFHKILPVLSSVRHFFSIAHHTPLTFFHKMLRTFVTIIAL
jgi:hypothetical protein